MGVVGVRTPAPPEAIAICGPRGGLFGKEVGGASSPSGIGVGGGGFVISGEAVGAGKGVVPMGSKGLGGSGIPEPVGMGGGGKG